MARVQSGRPFGKTFATYGCVSCCLGCEQAGKFAANSSVCVTKDYQRVSHRLRNARCANSLCCCSCWRHRRDVSPRRQRRARRRSSSRRRATTVPIGYLKQEVKKVIPLSRLKVEPEDIGIAGAEIALKDNNTTGRFTKQQFTLEVERVPVGGDAVAALEKLVRERPPLHCGGRAGRDPVASVGRGQRQGRALVQCSRDRRESAPGGLPGECAAHRAGPRHARRCARAISRVEEMAALAGGEGRLPRGPRLSRRGAQVGQALRRHDRRGARI